MFELVVDNLFALSNRRTGMPIEGLRDFCSEEGSRSGHAVNDMQEIKTDCLCALTT